MNYQNLRQGDALKDYMDIGHNRQYSHITLRGEKSDVVISVIVAGVWLEMWWYIGMTNIQVDMDCQVRFNYYNLIDFLIEEK